MCLTYFKCMLLIKHKMILFCKVASTHPVGWMTARGALQFGIRALQYERVLQTGIRVL
jgi:hypothetical protein